MYSLEEIVVNSERNINIAGNQMGIEKLKVAKITEIPSVLGESDIIKVSLLLPGVQSVGEGTAGINVRGSPTDQNVFYIDNVPIYNTSHFFGFFSAFHPDAIKEFSLYKSSLPAKFGGRLSSVFDISSKTGNREHFSARGGISPITGRVMCEGPFKKGKSSYLVALRSTYSDWALNFVDDTNIKNSSAKFADALINLSFSLSDNIRLKLFSYYNYDKIDIVPRNKYNYSNKGFSLSLNSIFRKKHDLNISLIYSDYKYNEENNELLISSYKYNYAINHNEIKASFNFRPNNKHKITIGSNSILYLFDRGKRLPLNDSSLLAPVYLGNEKGLESGIFISEEWNITPNITVNAGLRYNFYTYLGAGEVYKYQEMSPKQAETIIDTLTFGQNKSIKKYSAPDFRLSAKYIINPNFSVKASYNKLYQYIFMLSNTIASAPSDSWKLTDYNIKPMEGQQFSFGAYSNIGKNVIEISSEIYYKKVKNLIEFKDGVSLIGNKYPEQDILQGNLTSYGIEFMFKKPYGRFNGWLNYTYSKSVVEIDNKETGEKINFGKPYNANYDKPHAFNLVANYKVSRRFSVSSNIIYATGRPITYPSAIYFQNGMQILHYSKRNEYRIPDYFR
ncbi:MAG: TonB-dependent receptor, partial [bacterium]|nr:TonB-dependent receptor [bacterium]